MKRVRSIAGAVVALGVVVAVVAAVTTQGGGAGAQTNGDKNGAHLSSASVERRDLADRETVSGTLGYGDAVDLPSAANGTITAEAAEGSIVDRGQTLYEVDGVPIPLFFGARPFWRALSVNTEGEDVRELEANLVALGYGSGLTVDTKFTSATTRAVKKWQKAIGHDDTGIVQPGDVVVWPSKVRVAQHKVDVGDRAGNAVVSVTGTSQIVSVRLDVSKRSYVRAGDMVQVELPDGTKVGGRIYSVGRVATVDSGGDNSDTTPKIDVVVALDSTSGLDGVDQMPVDVYITRDTAKNVLAVPVRALLTLAEGGEAVEVVHGSTTQLVAVDTGTFADGWVEIDGNVKVGDRVVVAE